jgi:threonine-phosphate decarboxylase
LALLHGGNIYHFSRMFGIPLEDMADFSASINPLGPSPHALKAYRYAARMLDSYPDPDCTMFTQALSRYHDVPTASILPGNGSTELIYLLPRVLKPKRVVVLSPGFSDYERAAVLAGCKLQRIKLPVKNGFRPDIRGIAGGLSRSDMLFLCNPNNPTGVLVDRDGVLGLARAASKKGAFLVVDEAFVDYAPGASVIKEASGTPGVAVLRNFTKFFGMPGLRAGYLVARPFLVKRLTAHKEPWSVNTPAQAAAAASLEDASYIKKSLTLMERERKYLYGELSAVAGLWPFLSSANFMLVRLECGPGAAALCEELAKSGVLIRDCSNFRGLDGNFVRVAVRTRTENKRLIDLIKSSLYFTGR